MGEHWPFIRPSVPIPPTATEFDYGADISEILEEVPEPCEKDFIDGGDLDSYSQMKTLLCEQSSNLSSLFSVWPVSTQKAQKGPEWFPRWL